MLVVKTLDLQRKNYYASRPEDLGELVGKIEFMNGDGSAFTVRLNETQTRQIVAAVAEGILAAAQGLASVVKADVLAITATELKQLK